MIVMSHLSQPNQEIDSLIKDEGFSFFFFFKEKMILMFHLAQPKLARDSFTEQI